MVTRSHASSRTAGPGTASRVNVSRRSAEPARSSRLSSALPSILPGLVVALMGCNAMLGLDPRDIGLANGGRCEEERDCASGNCKAGICCDTACGEECHECATGTCRPKPAGTTCETDKACTANGACLRANGSPCNVEAVESECASGRCGAYGEFCDVTAEGQTCPGLCCTQDDCPDGACARCQGMSCDKTEDCAPALSCVGGEPSLEGLEGTCCAVNCATGERCAKDGSGCERPLGASCGVDRDCMAGHCADGVCCKEVCDVCRTCGTGGECVDDALGTSHADCADKASCDGNGACRTVVGVTALAFGGCALLSDGSVKCWGQYWPEGGTPAQVPKLDGADVLAGGFYHVCGHAPSGEMTCVTAGGQLMSSIAPSDPPPAVRDVDGMWTGPCALTTPAGQSGPVGLSCWRRDSTDPLQFALVATPQIEPSLATGAITKPLAYGCGHVCVIDGLGAVMCLDIPYYPVCGYNLFGELGNGTSLTQGKFVNAKGFDGSPGHKAVAVAAGSLHTCAIREDGSVWCWGRNDGGQLGPFAPKAQEWSTVPVQVDLCGGAPCGESDMAVAIALGQKHSCAALKSGAVWCWGDNSFGQLGNDSLGSSPTPVLATDAGSAPPHRQSISAGVAHTCVVTKAGGLKCFGSDAYGQLAGISNGGDDVGL